MSAIDAAELEGYTLIITPLLSLRDHINAHVTKPMLGHWAYTPKQLSSLNTSTMGEAEMLLGLRSTLGIEAADAALAAILPAWEELGSLDKVKEELRHHPGFPVLGKAIPLIAAFPSAWKNRQDYPGPSTYLDTSKVGVIGAEYLTGLDRVFLKNFTYEEIPLQQRKTKPLVIRMAGAANAVSACIELIRIHGPEQCCLITSGGGDLAPVLHQAGIPVMARPYTMRNYPPVQWFSTLLHLRLQGRDNWSGSCLDMLASAGTLTHKEANSLRGFHIARRSLPKPAQDFLSGLEACTTFGDLLPLTGKLTGLDILPLRSLLKKTALMQESITVENSYLFLKFLSLLGGDVGEPSRSGLLLADAANAVGITRPVQILLGVDESWLEHPITREQAWRNRDVEAKRREQTLRALFHQGQHTLCLLVDFAENEAVVANRVLGEALKAEKPADSPLKNIHIKPDCHYRGHVEWAAQAPKASTSEAKLVVREWSKSSLDTICACPRRLLYDRTLDFEKMEPHFSFGSALHSYAEMKLWQLKKEKERAERAQARLAVHTKDFLAQLAPEAISDAEAKLKRYKLVMDKLLAGVTPDCEPEKELKIPVGGLVLKGFIDVNLPSGEQWDFKSGQAVSARDKCARLPLGRFAPSEPDSQALAYLYLARARKAEQPSITFHFLGEMAKPRPNPQEVSLQLSLVSLTPSKELLEEMCVKSGGRGRFTAKEVASAGDRFLSLGEGDATALCGDLIAAMSLLEREALVTKLTGLLSGHFSDAGFVEKCISSILAHFSGMVLEQDLDAFKEYLLAQQERLQEANRHGFRRMPADKTVCDDCAYVTLCGERGYRNQKQLDLETTGEII